VILKNTFLDLKCQCVANLTPPCHYSLESFPNVVAQTVEPEKRPQQAKITNRVSNNKAYVAVKDRQQSNQIGDLTDDKAHADGGNYITNQIA
jgi:hypothetical protein